MGGYRAIHRAGESRIRDAARLPLTDRLKDAGAQTLRPLARADRIRPIIKEAIASRRYESEIKPHLTALEKKIVDRLASGKSLIAIERELAIDSTSASSHLINVEKKILRWQMGKPLRKHAGPHSRANAVRSIVEERIRKGETLNEIKKKSSLNRTECRVLDLYVLPKVRPTHEQVAARLGRKKVTVSCALYTIENKLRGLEPHLHLKKKYLAMSDAQLRKEIATHGVESKSELRIISHELHAVAKERGLLDELFPPRLSKALKEIAIEVKRQLRTKALHEVLRPLKPAERDLVTERVLARKPEAAGRFMEAHGISKNALRALQRKVLMKLKGLPTRVFTMDLIREVVERIGEKNLGMLRLTVRERQIIERRIRSEVPERLHELGSRWGVSRQRAGHIEAELLEKLRRFSEARRAA